MLALMKKEKGDRKLVLEDAPIPNFADDEVLIKVAYSGICGTDIHIINEEFTYYPPVIIGHEFSGEIVKTGSRVTDFKVGDKVVGEPHNRACGKCYLCRNGHIQNCRDKRSIGWGIDGSFTNYVVMPEKLLHKIPSGLSLMNAAMAEPCAIVAHQLLERARITPGDKVVIMGVGPIGIIAAKMAKIAGAGKIILTGCTSDIPYRLEVAKKLDCFDLFIDVQKEDAVKKISEVCAEGADIVVEASGAESAIRTAIKVLKKRGLLCAIGMTGKTEVSIPWNEAMMKVLDVQFNMSSSYNGWNIALSLLADGRLDVSPMIEVRTLKEYEGAFEDLTKGRAMKILLTPENEGDEDK